MCNKHQPIYHRIFPLKEKKIIAIVLRSIINNINNNYNNNLFNKKSRESKKNIYLYGYVHNEINNHIFIFFCIKLIKDKSFIFFLKNQFHSM